MFILDAIAHVESAHRVVPGDRGAALSIYQIHRVVWQDVKREMPVLDIGPNFEAIGNPDMIGRMHADNCAQGALIIAEKRLRGQHQPVTPENLYCVWNLGFTSFHRHNFDPAQCPEKTRANAALVAKLCREPPEHPHRRE